tara:strand:+ start:1761 stop:2210 length:450 start_codon:yes stop_codon:yes gene_type:complete
MKLSLVALLLLTSVPANAHEYQRGYTTQRYCYKEIYREQYVAGTQLSKGYVQSYTDRVEVPCTQMTKIHYHRHHHHRPTYHYSQNTYYQPTNSYRVSKSKASSSSCNSSIATGGLLGGGIAAALSKKDAYSWAIPLGAVVGLGVGGANC